MITIDSWKPIDIAILGITGATVLFTAFGAWYTIPWRRKSRREESTKEFNVFWQGRAVLELFFAFWVGAQLLRLSSIWSSRSFVFPSNVTNWTGAGWLCRVYITVAMGLLQPFCSLLTLLMFTSALKRSPLPPRTSSSFGPKRRSRKGFPNTRLFLMTFLATLPFLAAQTVVAWLSLAITYQGQQPEMNPRSVLGYFFATFWFGSEQQCDGAEGCAMCVFPASTVIIHLIFTVVLVIMLGVTASRVSAAVLNRELKRRLRMFWALDSLLMIAGAGALGGSIITGPFNWVNQGCWIGYFVTVVATILLTSWEVVIWPVRDVNRLSKRLKQWADPFVDSPTRETGEGYIKAMPSRSSHLLDMQPSSITHNSRSEVIAPEGSASIVSGSNTARSLEGHAPPPMALEPPTYR